MRQLATACGLNVATIYHYFPSKADLLRSVMAERRYGERLGTEGPGLDPRGPAARAARRAHRVALGQRPGRGGRVAPPRGRVAAGRGGGLHHRRRGSSRRWPSRSRRGLADGFPSSSGDLGPMSRGSAARCSPSSWSTSPSARSPPRWPGPGPRSSPASCSRAEPPPGPRRSRAALIQNPLQERTTGDRRRPEAPTPEGTP